MRKLEYFCDLCGEQIFPLGDGMYTFRHENVKGEAISGDNRILGVLHYCRKCFGDKIYPSLTKNN